MAANWYRGNAAVDGQAHREWILGHFQGDSDVRASKDVEIKWWVHPAGESRADWTTSEHRTTVVILVRGRFHGRAVGRRLRPGGGGRLPRLGARDWPLMACARGHGDHHRSLAIHPAVGQHANCDDITPSRRLGYGVLARLWT
jgi:hypothetical protein